MIFFLVILSRWADATVDFMISGGYNVSAQIQLLYANLLCHLNQQMLLSFCPVYTKEEPLLYNRWCGNNA